MTTRRATSGGLLAKIKLIKDRVMGVTCLAGEMSTNRGGTSVYAIVFTLAPGPAGDRAGRNSHAAAALRDPRGSVKCDAHAELDDVLLPPRKGRSETPLVYISHSAVHVVHNRRERDVSADPDVVSHAAGEPPTRAVEGGARIDVIVGEPEAARDE